MNDDIKLRYNRDFLKWSNNKFKSFENSQLKPKHHVYPTKGLLNDPNCIFYKNEIYYIFFQHHPKNPLHGLKTMSLAKTKDFNSFEYSYMINKPSNDFDSHGIYSGNAIVLKDKVLAMYTGNSRDRNWIRTSSIVISIFDVEKNEFTSKQPILNNFDYSNYTEHFRDPYVFLYKSKLFFLLGAQTKKEQGVILLFELDKNLKSANLIREISISNKYRMIECPNIAFIKNKAILIYSPQYKMSEIPKGENPDIVRYLVINPKKMFETNKFSITIDNSQKTKEQILDFGLEYYAPQTFLKNNKWHIIGWSGIPTSNNYPESKDGWIFVLSMIKELNLEKNKLVLKEIKNWKKIFQESKERNIFFKEFKIGKNEKLIIKDNQKNELSIERKNDGKITIERKHDKNYFPYISKKTLNTNLKNGDIDVEIYFDVSIIEIKFAKKYWYTSRFYLDKRYTIERVYE